MCTYITSFYRCTNCMLLLSISQPHCIRVQQTVGQRSNRIESTIVSTYWFVICNVATFLLLLTIPPFSNRRWHQFDIFIVKYVTKVTGFILLYQGNIKACGFGKTLKFKYKLFAPRHQNFKSGFGFGFYTFTFWKKYVKLNVSITDESVTTQTWWFAWLIPLSATEQVPQTVCPSRILTLYL